MVRSLNVIYMTPTQTMPYYFREKTLNQKIHTILTCRIIWFLYYPKKCMVIYSQKSPQKLPSLILLQKWVPFLKTLEKKGGGSIFLGGWRGYSLEFPSPNEPICARVKSRYIGDGHPTFNRESGNPYNGYINPYYWVDEFIPYYMEIMGV